MKTLSLLISVFLICCLWITNTRSFMSLDYFAKEIVPLCYGRRDEQNKELPNGQKVPIPNTLETFVSLLEKIEHLHPNWSIEDIVKSLLVSFRYDDLIYKPNSNFKSRSSSAGTAFDILKIIFGKPSETWQKVGKNDLTEDEKCALYFMISHTVNDTVREGDEAVANNNKRLVTKMPREQGVVMLNSNFKHSFALGKVLLGILAGLRSNKKVNAQDTYAAVNSLATKSERLQNTEVSVLYAATFGDLLSLAAEANEPGESLITDIFLPNGWWNEADCPLYYNLATTRDEYTLLSIQVHTTYASIRGAIDGYVLGEVIERVVQNYRNIRLSQILRAYYNIEELYDGNKESISWCLRQPKFDKLKPQLQEEAKSYHLLYSAAKGETIGTKDDDIIDKSINDIFTTIATVESDIITDIYHADGSCGLVYSRPCETDTNFFAIMDYKSPENVQIQQREIFGNLTAGLQMSEYGSTASIYTNLKPSKGGNELEAIINFTTYSSCASCAAKYYKPYQVSTEAEPQVFRYLNHTLTLFDEEHDEKAGVPAKVLLYFNFASPNLEDWQLKEAVWAFRRAHPDVKVLAIGKKDSLKLFVSDEEKDILTLPPPTNTQFHKNLKERICKIPAIFQYKNCRTRTDSDELSNKYEGFITPKHVQYWAMYPKYFLKSYGIKLTFQALRGQLKVCFSRYYSEIFDQKEPLSGTCKETTNSENAVDFYVSNPCHRYSVESCPPFYFYIEGKMTQPSSTNDMPCTDERCKTPDQIQFEFIHQGISCNKGSILSYSFSIMFYVILGAMFWLFSQRKY